MNFAGLIFDVLANTGQKFASSQRHDPYRNFNYEVSFSGFKAVYGSGWSYVSGVKVRNDYKEYKEGGNNGVPDQIHDSTIYEPITMERGMSEDMSLIQAFNGQFDKSGKGVLSKNRFTITIKIKDRDNKKVVRTIKLKDAWITAFETSDLMGLGTEVLINRVIVTFKSVDFS